MNKTEIPKRYRKIFERTQAGSRSAAVRAKCLECMGYSSVEVKTCTSPDCPLYHWRTGKYTGLAKPGRRTEGEEDLSGGDE